jgi:C1A family cysteine protease
LAQLSEDDLEKLRERGRAEGWTFEIGENEATHRPLSELCGTVVPPGFQEEEPDGRFAPRGPGRDLPAAYDWRDYGGCTPIRNQGGCGSCWAFSAVGAVESAILINDGLSRNLSEQWLVSCCDAGTCGGGWPREALRYMCLNDAYDYCGDAGAVLESDFPYVAWDAPCGCPYPHPYWIDDWSSVGAGWPPNVDMIKQAILDYGPVSVTVAVDGAFQGYNGGVFNGCWDGTINHAVVLVGWDDNQGSNGIWIMRNSWGTWWGEDGYMRIEYGCSSIGSNAVYVEYRFDCNGNGIRDDYDIANCDGSAWCSDCNGNLVPDTCDITGGASRDCDENGVPDECEAFAGSSRLYVNDDATGAQTGTSWTDALTKLRTAVCFAQDDPTITEIWVAGGTYAPAGPGGDRTATFQLVNNLTISGSFAGTETSRSQRDLSDPANRSILSGDLNGDDGPGFVNNGENSYHVVTGTGTDATAVLDGFAIVGGNANAPSHDRGAGLRNNAGSPTIVNCIFAGNSSASSGGAMANEQGTMVGGSCPTIINCVLTGNSAGGLGGAIYNIGNELSASYPSLSNCTIVGNSAALGGGVASEYYSAPTLANCILWGNTDIDTQGDLEDEQIFFSGASPVVDYCCVEGLTGSLGGAGNIDGPPLFVDADGTDDVVGTLDDNLRLTVCSACIDAGDNLSVPGGTTIDLDSGPRFVDDAGMPDDGNPPEGAPIVEMGAYEFLGETCYGDLNGDFAVDFSDLGGLLANYGVTSGATYPDGDMDRNGTVDASDLGEILPLYDTSCP